MASFNLTTASGLFKTKYVRLSRDMYNSENVVQARVKKTYNFVGEDALIAVPTTFTGGVGSGVKPTANAGKTEKMRIVAKKLYGTVQIDRETIKAASTDEGAFVRATKEQVKRCVSSWNRNLSRIFFNSLANGSLGTYTGNASGTASAPVITVSAATWKQANWEPRDYVNVNSLASVFEITGVNPATRAVTLARISGSDDLTGVSGGIVYMQNSKDNDPTSFANAVAATSGNLYTIPVGYRWQAPSQINAGGAPLTVDVLNQMALDIKYNFGESPDMFALSFVQFRKLLNQLEDQKRYTTVESRESGPKGKFSFRALEFMTDAGPVPIIADRFIEDDRCYAINSDHVEIMHRPDFGWADDDGTVFLRDPHPADSYSATYAGYLEIVTTPSAHGYAYGLAV